MLLPCLPFNKRFRTGLTILESLVLLLSSIFLALVIVPVLLMKWGYIKPRISGEVDKRPAQEISEPKPIALPLRSLPEAPKLPSSDKDIVK